ncbi:heterogeneous nuclear ribonucleoprotein A1, A2/B1 homolog isoform X4 [Linepithema humile]|uniref:heterogeneous nuclear ribonucleoprotein A1, A2/B1 homolog isoform X4 n=1 Tax=Linepithema humile TaxID=83485 RepID=UPI000623853D|nr:PREDICTED: keratin, type II cytoskeletal 1-like isoform X4 [Linepithema humile]
MQCIYRTPNTLTMAVRALGLVLLFSLVASLSGLPPPPPPSSPELTVNTHEEHTLSTELQPPPLDEKEHHATLYIINLYAVKNSSGNTSEEIFENDVIEAVPEIAEPFATVLLLVDDEDEEKKRSAADLDEFAEGLENKGIKVDKIDLNKDKLLRVKLHKFEAQSMVDAAAKPGDATKDRKKRTVCMKCGGGGGGYGGGHRGGYGGGKQPYGGGGYPSGGGGGCNTCGGGGYGGGGSYSQSSASAQSSSGSWGGK